MIRHDRARHIVGFFFLVGLIGSTGCIAPFDQTTIDSLQQLKAQAPGAYANLSAASFDAAANTAWLSLLDGKIAYETSKQYNQETTAQFKLIKHLFTLALQLRPSGAAALSPEAVKESQQNFTDGVDKTIATENKKPK